MDPHPSALILVVLLSGWLGADGAIGGGFRHKGVSPPPGYKHSAFRLIVPQPALATLHWHAALRHAAFLSLRRRLSSYGDGSRAERTLWEHIAQAPVFPLELAKPTNEDADLTILASGLLVREVGHLAFVPEHFLLQATDFPRKISALWSVIRVRHSGPGLPHPRVEYYFTVQPASHMTLLEHMDKRKKIRPPVGPPTAYRGPVFGSRPGQYYDPQFVDVYRNVIQNYVANPDEEQPNLLTLESAKEEKVIFKQDPIYILPSPRLVKPHFPKVSNVARLNYPNPSVVVPNKMLKLHIHSPDHIEAESSKSQKIVQPQPQNSTEAPEEEPTTTTVYSTTTDEPTTTKTTRKSSRYRSPKKSSS